MPNLWNRIEPHLLSVNRPARYMGGEWNAVEKDLSRVKVKVALAFPDTYEVGMSHLGSRILYSVLNKLPGVACERVFAPWVDMESVMRRENISLFSLESKLPLAEFDIVGFSLAYELTYTNVLNMLNLASIPIWAEERSSRRYPLIIAGGPCTFNPEPMSLFFDAMVIGDGEEVMVEIVELVKKYRRSKKKLLEKLAKVEGVYVPRYKQAIIKKRTLSSLQSHFYPTKQIVPYIKIIHDRVSLEIMRGCPHKCRFCQATVIYHPTRRRKLEQIFNLAEQASQATGYDEVSLISLSTGSYPQIKEAISYLVERFHERGISVSLPSLRIEDGLLELPGLISRIKKTGLTLAPEAGTARLRKVIGKNLDIEKLLDAAKKAYECGWRRIKLYFMIGLPTETKEDLDGIRDLIYKVSDLRRAVAGRPAEINASIASFVPKPHTPFQWLAMADMATLLEKQNYLRKTINAKCIELNFTDVKSSFLEGALSCGDASLSKVIYKAWEKGAKFDSWREHFKFDIWLDAFNQMSIEPNFYATRHREESEKLPWAHIDAGLRFHFTDLKNS